VHYYKRNIGDYHKKAGRLSMLQHGAYTLLIDSCYDREKFPTVDDAIDWCWASSAEEVEAVKFVLSKFFVEEDGFYVQSRIQEDLDRYHLNAQTNKRIAIEREAKRVAKSTKRAQSVNEAPPNHKPLTINQEPIPSSPSAEGGAQEVKSPQFSETDLKFAKWMLSIISDKLPNFKTPNLNGWAKTIRLMREIDKREYSEMSDTWLWCRDDEFWSTNVLSADKFRKQYDTLYAKSQSVPQGNYS
jgi:uncharacterized protein YdaU (DUF1376 family)